MHMAFDLKENVDKMICNINVMQNHVVGYMLLHDCFDRLLYYSLYVLACGFSQGRQVVSYVE